jgi:parallel beta-helix repeat protein
VPCAIILSECIVANSSTGALGLIVVGNSSVVTNCIVNNNDLQGLKVVGSGNRITNNHATANDQNASGCADIYVTGTANFVQDNLQGLGTTTLVRTSSASAPPAASSIATSRTAVAPPTTRTIALPAT